MSRFVSKILYGLEYYFRRYFWFFLGFALCCVVGLVVGAILESVVCEFYIFGDVNSFVDKTFFKLFWSFFAPNTLLLLLIAVFGCSYKTLWLSFLAALCFGFRLGCVCAVLWLALGVCAIFYYIFYVFLQILLLIAVAGFCYAICDDNSCCIGFHNCKVFAAPICVLGVVCLIFAAVSLIAEKLFILF